MLITKMRRHIPENLFQVSSNGKPNSTLVLIGTQIATAVLRLVSNAILTRILVPEDFGIMLLVSSVMTVVQMTMDMSVSTYVVSNDRGANPHTLNTLWTVNIIRSVLMSVIVIALAPFIAALLGQPETTDAIRAVGLLILTGGFIPLSLPQAVRAREEWRNSLAKFAVFIAQTVTTLVACYYLRSYWGVVIGMLLNAPFLFIAMHFLHPYKYQKIDFDMKEFIALWKFSRLLVASSFLTLVMMQFDKFFVLSKFDIAQAGLFGLAMSLVVTFEMVSNNFASSVYLGEVSSRLRAGAMTPSTYYEPMRLFRPATTFVAAGGIFFGTTFFEIVFDDRYLLGGTFFSILVIRAIFSITVGSAKWFLIATENTKYTLIGNLLVIAWLALVVPLAWHYYGVMGVIWAVALMDLPQFSVFYFKLFRLNVLSLKWESVTIAAALVGLAVGGIATIVVSMFL